MKITIGFSRPRKFKPFAWAIQKVDGTDYSHVFIRFKSDSFDRQLVYQASHTAVNFFEGSIFDASNETLESFELELDPDTYKKTIVYAIDRAGVPYGIRQVFGILYVKVLNRFGINASNPFADGSKAYVCSELVAEILSKFTTLHFSNLDLVTPKMIFDAISNYSEAKKV